MNINRGLLSVYTIKVTKSMLSAKSENCSLHNYVESACITNVTARDATDNLLCARLDDVIVTYVNIEYAQRMYCTVHGPWASILYVVWNITPSNLLQLYCSILSSSLWWRWKARALGRLKTMSNSRFNLVQLSVCITNTRTSQTDTCSHFTHTPQCRFPTWPIYRA